MIVSNRLGTYEETEGNGCKIRKIISLTPEGEALYKPKDAKTELEILKEKLDKLYALINPE